MVQVRTAWLKCWVLVWFAARWVDVGASRREREAQIGFKFNICLFPARLFVKCVELLNWLTRSRFTIC